MSAIPVGIILAASIAIVDIILATVLLILVLRK